MDASSQIFCIPISTRIDPAGARMCIHLHLIRPYDLTRNFNGRRLKPPRYQASRIGEHSIWAEFGSGRYEGSRDVIWPENVKDNLASGDQII
jgi:hypothetical protein